MEFIIDKPRLQRMYTEILKKAGYEPEIEPQGDIAFIHKNSWFVIEIYDEDLNFGRLCRIIETQFDNETIIHAYIAASEVSGSFKLTKAYIRDKDFNTDVQFIVFAIGFLLDHPGDFKKNLERMLDEMLSAYQTFNEVMSNFVTDGK
jgi:hypothetical protein